MIAERRATVVYAGPPFVQMFDLASSSCIICEPYVLGWEWSQLVDEGKDAYIAMDCTVMWK